MACVGNDNVLTVGCGGFGSMNGVRFREPHRPQPWEGVRDTRDLPNICMQLRFTDSFVLGDEDCLYLHVYAPPRPADGTVTPIKG